MTPNFQLFSVYSFQQQKNLVYSIHKKANKKKRLEDAGRILILLINVWKTLKNEKLLSIHGGKNKIFTILYGLHQNPFFLPPYISKYFTESNTGCSHKVEHKQKGIT